MPGASPLDHHTDGVKAPTPPRRGHERLPRLLLWGFLSAVLLGVAGLGVWSLMVRQPVASLKLPTTSPQLPVYGTVPAFTLTERSGRVVRLEDLRGHVWIASFIFTHCPNECPLMTAEMAQLQADFAAAPDLRLVSITVDPDRDTAAVLAQYAARFEADPERWLFLTGEKRSIHQLATEGFRLGIIDPTEASQGLPGKGQAVRTSAFGPRSQSLLIWETIAEHASSLLTWLPTLTPAPVWADHGQGRDIGHSSRFVLIDRQGRIRGYYQSRDDAELQRLRRHTAGLLRGP